MASENDSDDNEDIIFIKAREFLQLVGRTQPNDASIFINKSNKELGTNTQSNRESNSNSSQSEKCLKRKIVHFGAYKKKTIKTENTEHHNKLTPHKRRKLERIKVPVTSFAKPIIKQTEIKACAEDESVHKMLQHMSQLPRQDFLQSISIPMVFTPKQDEERNHVCDTSSSAVDYMYLSSEKDLATWKMLNNSLTNRNVFVGNLCYKVDQFVLKSVFETLVAKEQQHLLKVRLVTEPHSGASKGYGFVEFPNRRATELALICLQGFELHGREMQLGWGQNVKETTQDCFKSQSKNGTIISDTRLANSKKYGKDTQRRLSTRWDVELHEGNSVNHVGISGEYSLSIHRTSTEEKEQSRKLSSERRQRQCKSNVKFSTFHKRTAIDWLAKEQRINLIKTVCENLRKKNVAGHLGVFGEHFETDNTGFNVF